MMQIPLSRLPVSKHSEKRGGRDLRTIHNTAKRNGFGGQVLAGFG